MYLRLTSDFPINYPKPGTSEATLVVFDFYLNSSRNLEPTVGPQEASS